MTFNPGDLVTYHRLNLETHHLTPTVAIITKIGRHTATLDNGDIYPFSLLTHADPRPQQLHPDRNPRRRR